MTDDTHDEDFHDSAYAGLLDHHTVMDDSQWAFGAAHPDLQGDDPLAGVDTAVPDGVDHAALAAYCLMLGDDALVLSHRLSEWCSNAPDLEEDIALANIALDLLGQARLLLARAEAADPSVVPALPADSPVPAEDALAFFRADRDFRNVRLVESDNGDFAVTIARLLLFSTWRLALLQRLVASRDQVLSAIAVKAVKEVTYHRDYAGRWFVTLAQGTAHSRERLLAAVDLVWRMCAELFVPTSLESALDDSWCRRGPGDSGRRGRRRAGARVRRRRGRLAGRASDRAGERRQGSRRPAHRGVLAPARGDAVGRACPPGGPVVAVVDLVERTDLLEQARDIAASVTDPEMPMLTLEDLGVLRSVELEDDATVVVTITPTYSGCPAMATMRDDLVHRLADSGLRAVVRVSLTPAWSSDWITPRGRRALVEHGISAPLGAAREGGPVAISLLPTRRDLSCPRCGGRDVELISEFGPTACKAMYRCTSCLEPFEHVKEI